MEEKKPPTTSGFAGFGAGEWIMSGVIIVIVLLCLAFCGWHSDSKKSETHKSDSTALVKCKRYANAKFPYGFKYSTLDTDITEIDGRTRVTFYDAKISNVYGAERTVTVHCDVSGGSVVDFTAL